ncbi:MAG: DUF1638 domain-containing protein [Desulforhopalus sp.]
MSLAIICCQSLEQEIKAIIQDVPEVTHLEVMDWKLHIDPDLLLKAVTERIEVLQKNVDAIMLGYGRCQAMDRLPNHYTVPIFRPDADDCIGILLGQDRYEKELYQEAGTWFFTPGWTEMGMEYIFHELQISQLVDKFTDKGKDPMDLARRMLKDYTRGLFIDVGVGDLAGLMKKAENISEDFGFRLERTRGSLQLLEDTLKKALDSIRLHKLS